MAVAGRGGIEIGVVLFAQVIHRRSKGSVPTNRLVLQAHFILAAGDRLERCAGIGNLLHRHERGGIADIRRHAVVELVHHAALIGEFLVLGADVARLGDLVAKITVDPILTATEQVILALDLCINPFHLLFEQGVLHCNRCGRVAQVYRVIHIDRPDDAGVPVLIERGTVVARAEQHGVLQTADLEFAFQLVIQRVHHRFVEAIVGSHVQARAKTGVVEVARPGFVAGNPRLHVARVLPELPIIIE